MIKTERCEDKHMDKHLRTIRMTVREVIDMVLKTQKEDKSHE